MTTTTDHNQATTISDQDRLAMALAELAAERAENARLMAEREAAKQAARDRAMARGLTYKVSEKGAVSVYGLGRWPVTLYDEQWDRLDSPDEQAKRKAFRDSARARGALKSHADR